LPQDRRGQRLQLRNRVDAQLVGQAPAQRVVNTQRVGLPPVAVQPQHEQAVQPLPERVGGHQSVQVGHRLAVPAQLQLQLQPILDRTQPQVVQPGPLRTRPLGVADIGQRRSAPQPERLVIPGQHGRQVTGQEVTGPDGGARPAHQTLEPVRVHRLGRNGQLIPRSTGHQDIAAHAGRHQRAAQLGHPSLQGVTGVDRRIGAPQRIGQGVGRDHPARCQGQPGQQRPHRRGQHGRCSTRGLHLDRPEHPDRGRLLLLGPRCGRWLRHAAPHH
jgi:hypothetical protein